MPFQGLGESQPQGASVYEAARCSRPVFPREEGALEFRAIQEVPRGWSSRGERNQLLYLHSVLWNCLISSNYSRRIAWAPALYQALGEQDKLGPCLQVSYILEKETIINKEAANQFSHCRLATHAVEERRQDGEGATWSLAEEACLSWKS